MEFFLNELNKFLSVIKAVRDSRLHEIDYTNEIEELMNGFNVGCELSNTNYQFDYSVNSYADKGKRWFGTFSDNWNKIRVSVIHIPTDKNIGQRIEINFNSREFNFSMFIAGRFFFKDYVVKRVHGYNYSIKFEDPKEIVRILNFLNGRLEDEA
jgi:hypothetical protein